MTYNQTKVNGVAMPLLMGCTEPTAIEVAGDDPRVLYNSNSQITEIEIELGRQVGTKCLRACATVKKFPSGNKYNVTDKKNEIDDSKFVV